MTRTTEASSASSVYSPNANPQSSYTPPSVGASSQGAELEVVIPIEKKLTGIEQVDDDARPLVMEAIREGKTDFLEIMLGPPLYDRDEVLAAYKHHNEVLSEAFLINEYKYTVFTNLICVAIDAVLTMARDFVQISSIAQQEKEHHHQLIKILERCRVHYSQSVEIPGDMPTFSKEEYEELIRQLAFYTNHPDTIYLIRPRDIDSCQQLLASTVDQVLELVIKGNHENYLKQRGVAINQRGLYINRMVQSVREQVQTFIPKLQAGSNWLTIIQSVREHAGGVITQKEAIDDDKKALLNQQGEITNKNTAIKLNHRARAKKLLKECPQLFPREVTEAFLSSYDLISVNAVIDNQKNTLLHFAAMHGLYDVCRWLMERGANPQLQNISGAEPCDLVSPLDQPELYALLHGDQTITVMPVPIESMEPIKIMLRMNPQPRHIAALDTINDTNEIFKAAAEGSIEFLRFLLDPAIPVKAAFSELIAAKRSLVLSQLKYEYCHFMTENFSFSSKDARELFTVSYESLEAVYLEKLKQDWHQFLTSLGITRYVSLRDTRTNSGKIVFEEKVYDLTKPETLSILVERLALESLAELSVSEIFNTTTYESWSPRELSSKLRELEQAQEIMCDLHRAIFTACLNRHRDVCQLKAHRENRLAMLIKLQKKMPPIYQADSSQGQERLLNIRLENINGRNIEGKTLLEVAIEAGQEEIVKLLLAHGADPLAKSSFGKTILEFSGRLTEKACGDSPKKRAADLSSSSPTLQTEAGESSASVDDTINSMNDAEDCDSPIDFEDLPDEAAAEPKISGSEELVKYTHIFLLLMKHTLQFSEILTKHHLLEAGDVKRRHEYLLQVIKHLKAPGERIIRNALLGDKRSKHIKRNYMHRIESFANMCLVLRKAEEDLDLSSIRIYIAGQLDPQEVKKKTGLRRIAGSIFYTAMEHIYGMLGANIREVQVLTTNNAALIAENSSLRKELAVKDSLLVASEARSAQLSEELTRSRLESAAAKEEAAAATQRADEATQRADEAMQRVDEATQRADEATQRADEATQRADEAMQRVDEATQRADEATQRADTATQRADAAVAEAATARQETATIREELQVVNDAATTSSAKVGELTTQVSQHEANQELMMNLIFTLQQKVEELGRQRMKDDERQEQEIVRGAPASASTYGASALSGGVGQGQECQHNIPKPEAGPSQNL